jgi:NADPH2:quinone reductase
VTAIVVHEHGGPDVLVPGEQSEPQPAADQVVVRLHAIGVNPVDTYVRAGSQGYDRPVPFTPGLDGAGVVGSTGDGVTGVVVGDRVWVGGSVTGTYAEKCLCANGQVHRLPDTYSYEEGACLYVNYVTAYRALSSAAVLPRVIPW